MMNEQQKFSFQLVVSPVVYFSPKSHELHCYTQQRVCNKYKTTLVRLRTAWKTRKQAMAMAMAFLINTNVFKY